MNIPDLQQMSYTWSVYEVSPITFTSVYQVAGLSRVGHAVTRGPLSEDVVEGNGDEYSVGNGLPQASLVCQAVEGNGCW